MFFLNFFPQIQISDTCMFFPHFFWIYMSIMTIISKMHMLLVFNKQT